MKKLNYLIIVPRFVENTGDLYGIPVGVCYISAMMKSKKYNVFNLNLNNFDEDIEVLIGLTIKENNIDVVAVGGIVYMYNKISRILDIAKSKNVTTIVGGGIITSSPTIVMKGLVGADIGIMGEGEYSICDVANALENNLSLKNIKGIVYKENNNIVITEAREDIIDLDALPFPDFEGNECGHLNKVENVVCFNNAQYVCEQCEKTFINPINELINVYVKKAFSEGLKKHKKIAVWGAVRVFLDFYEKCSVLKNIYLIDVSQAKQENNEYKIYSPQVLKDEEFDIVLVAASNFFDDIKKEINVKYKNIKEVVAVSDFVFDEVKK